MVCALQPPLSHSAASFSIFVICAAVRFRFAKVAEHFPFMSLPAIPAQQAASSAKSDEAARRLLAMSAKVMRFMKREDTPRRRIFNHSLARQQFARFELADEDLLRIALDRVAMSDDDALEV